MNYDETSRNLGQFAIVGIIHKMTQDLSNSKVGYTKCSSGNIWSAIAATPKHCHFWGSSLASCW